ncbi:unnamed protein product, partial [marine sediment metagenome]
EKYGIRMYHYSYVFADQVYQKIAYYKAAISKDNCIDNYFNEIYIPWILGNEMARNAIESKYKGVHEFKVSYRKEAYTKPFEGTHPKVILDSMNELKEKFNEQLKKYV